MKNAVQFFNFLKDVPKNVPLQQKFEGKNRTFTKFFRSENFGKCFNRGPHSLTQYTNTLH